MNPSTISTMLASQMTYMTDRQSVLAQNMANIDTPGYSAQDLKKLDFHKIAAESGSHMAMRPAAGGKSMNGTLNGGGAFSAEKTRKAYDVTPTGSNVVLEEQMAKISDTGAQFQVASNLYKKFNSLYNASIGKNTN